MGECVYRARITLSEQNGGSGGASSARFEGALCGGVARRGDGALARRAHAYLRAATATHPYTPPVPVGAPACPAPHHLPRLHVLSRLAAIPLVESGLHATDAAYHSLKESSPLAAWSLCLGEQSLARGAALAAPVAGLGLQLVAPAVRRLDAALCASLDALEQRLPSILLPPEAMYSSSRQFVVRRADSVRQLGAAVLESRVSAVTAGALDRALSAADEYVDRYLPPDGRDAADVAIVVTRADESGRARAAATVHHGARLSRKLTRRLTRQALAEAKALREQIHVLAYVAELVATDPARAWREAKRLYAALSRPEPENQARPATLEELLVLLAREAARRVVHLLNYAHSDLPRSVRGGMALLSRQLAAGAEALLRAPAVQAAQGEAGELRAHLLRLLARAQEAAAGYLEALALLLAGNGEREKLTPAPRAHAHGNGLD